MLSEFLGWYKDIEIIYQIIIFIIGFLAPIGIWKIGEAFFTMLGEKYFKERETLIKLKSDKTKYKDILKKEVGSLELLIPGLSGKSVSLSEETFVHLRLSHDLRTESHIHPGEIERFEKDKDDIKPLNILNRAFSDGKNRVLLIVGDPGSGKTTLIKYFIQVILSKNGYKKLNINKPVFPFLFYLRNLDLKDGDLYTNLENWTNQRQNKINAEFFKNLLTRINGKMEYYLFLDGIDEAGDKESRKEVCQFISNLRLPDNVKIIVSTRYTGISSQENIHLACPHVRADLKDFNEKQKIDFLRKWLNAVDQSESDRIEIDRQVQDVIDYINLPENKDIKELTGIPIILNLLALIWYNFKKRPANRSQIFKHALDYLIQYRDDQRGMQPLVDNGSARKILQPISLDMQKNEHDEIEVDNFKRSTLVQIQANNLKTLANEDIDVKEFCENMVKRASIISEQGDMYFVFKHKSFREYFAGVEIEHLRTANEMQCLVENLQSPWWMETIKHFFENITGTNAFNPFFSAFFKNKVSKKYITDISSLLIECVKLAPFKNEKIFEDVIDDDKNDSQKMYALDCLLELKKDNPTYLKTLPFIEKLNTSKLKKHINARIGFTDEYLIVTSSHRIELNNAQIHHNDQEYIHLKSGQFDYSVNDNVETVPDLYFGKYPVTNRSYRRFINYLNNQEKLDHLPVNTFFEKLIKFAETIEGFGKYHGNDKKKLIKKLASGYDEDRKFNSDEQPVVGVSWYDAKAYCLWLSLIEAAGKKDWLDKPLSEIAGIYRLPKDIEWERAAKGIKEDNSYPREFPWGNKEPSPELANYKSHIGNTTPVDRYPNGSTPDGVLDMAGNVWEWCQDFYDDKKDARVVRGGSWIDAPLGLRCSDRDWVYPGGRYVDVGFRVVCSLRL